MSCTLTAERVSSLLNMRRLAIYSRGSPKFNTCMMKVLILE